MLELYLTPPTVNSRKVLAGLELLGTNYHVNILDFEAGEHKTPDFLKINPMGTVPAAVIDGDITSAIMESNAILQYAADLDEQGSSAYPKDLKKRAKINAWLLWEASAWFPSCYVYMCEFCFKDPADLDQAVIDAQAPRWNQLAGVLDAQLAKTKWLTGDEITSKSSSVSSSRVCVGHFQRCVIGDIIP